MSRFKELEQRVNIWAGNKGIFDKGTPISQIKKTLEEVYETMDALEAQEAGQDTFINSKGETVNTKAEIKDGFGDALVTILIGCTMQSLNSMDALESSLDIIEGRDGEMINGQFVKDQD